MPLYPLRLFTAHLAIGQISRVTDHEDMSPTEVEDLIGTTIAIGLKATAAARLDMYPSIREAIIQVIEITIAQATLAAETFGLELDFRRRSNASRSR